MNASRQRLDPMPGTEGPDEADRAPVAEAEALAHSRAVEVGPEPLRIDPVRKDDNALLRDAAGENVLAQRLADHADEVRGLKICLLDPRRQFWIESPMPQCSASQASGPLNSRTKGSPACRESAAPVQLKAP